MADSIQNLSSTTLMSLILLLAVLGIYVQVANAQSSPQNYSYPHHHLPWFTIEGDHFLVHYQEGNSRSAQVASRIAEEIYHPITELYQHEPDTKISIVLRDREDRSNGAAYFFENKIEIQVPSFDMPLRGSHNWLRNVVTHEFIHVIQLQSSMRRSRKIPALYLQWLSYEEVRRPDILYGTPKGILTYPFSSVSIPAWFAEGVAQYQRTGLTYDYWDSHRDMVLRTRILDNRMLDLTEMSTFTSKSGLERELVYNQGFSFTIYLVYRFGEEILHDISRAAASGNHRFEKTLEIATGVSGEQLFDEWIENRRQFYRSATEPMQFTQSALIEEEGFYNFYPQYSPSASRLAYLSNRNRDFNRTGLYIRDLNEETASQQLVSDMGGPKLLATCNSCVPGHRMETGPLLDFIGQRFSFSPDGKKIAYSRAHKNNFGEVYEDLYIFDLETRSREQLTRSQRIHSPAWHPGSDRMAAVQLTDGTQNLVLFNPNPSDDEQKIKPLTRFNSGETVYTPVWHPDGTKIYFSSSSLSNRSIYLFNLETGRTEEVLTDGFIDNRDPFVSRNGAWMYFATDLDGIFNIFRMDLESPGQPVQKVTNVRGGAFMPFARNDTLYYAEYQTEGYKIAAMPLLNRADDNSGSYTPPPPDPDIQFETGNYDSIQEFGSFDDRDLASLNHEELLRDSTLSIPTKYSSDERSWYPYRDTSTGFNFVPVLRFDNYTQKKGPNSRLLRNGDLGGLGQNLWRDMKAGLIFSTRDVTEKLSFTGGALVGFGSRPADGFSDFFRPGRLNKLDRDLFLDIEYRGLPFIQAGWSPTVTLELYNLKRNVQDGLKIEEFPCTSCLPETTSTDIIYDIWEANLSFKSKLSRWSMLELGASYSPYRVSSDGFFSRQNNRFIPGETSEYFRGTTWTVSYITEQIKPWKHADIAPVGIKGNITYRYQPGKLLDRYDIQDGFLTPHYQSVQNHSLEVRTQYGIKSGRRGNGLITLRGFSYLNHPNNYFYLDYIGGLSGLRSYPYFAVGGEQTLFARFSYLFPLVEHINRQAGPYTFDKLFLHLFAETGNGWNSPLEIGNTLKTGIGAEFRFAFNSYYLYPMKFFLSSSYGFNRFNVTLSDDFITGTDSNQISYGRDILIHFGLMFDFNLY